MAVTSKKGNGKIGAWAFLGGLILAVILGLFSASLNPSIYSVIVALLVIAGILVGLLNVTSKESQGFLLAGVSLVIVSYCGQGTLTGLGNITWIGPILSNVLSSLMILFVPTTIIVALKSVFELAKD